MYARILGTGSYLPDRIMPNSELESIVDTSDEWIQARTGIKQRHIAAEDESTCDMGEAAVRRALEAAGVEISEIDLIVFATSTPDLVFPSTACLLQQRLGQNTGAPAFDIQAVCSGFVYALAVADQFIRSGMSRRALVIGADCNSKILDWNDRGTCVLFGDGAGAVVLGNSDEPGIYHSCLHADGNYADKLMVGAGVSRKSGEPYIRMQGSDVFKFAVNIMEEVVDEILAATGMGKEDIDWLIPHQANLRIITATAKKLGMPMDRLIVTLQDQGNTSAASIPLALDIAVRDGRVKPGDRLLLEAVGGGFTWGANLLRY